MATAEISLLAPASARLRFGVPHYLPLGHFVDGIDGDAPLSSLRDRPDAPRRFVCTQAGLAGQAEPMVTFTGRVFWKRPSLPVSPARPQIIDMRRRCRRQPLVTCIAIVIEFSIENLLRGSPTNTWPGTSPPAPCTCPGRSCPPSPTSSDHTPCIASAASAQAKSHHLRSADSENPPAIAIRTAAAMPMKSPFALLNRCPGEFAAGVVDGACLGPEPPWSEILS